MTRDADPHTPPPPTGDPGGSAGIWSVVLLYAAFAGLWILLSDKVVELLWSDPAQIILASTLKGWAFVAVNSLLLYGLMRRLLRPSAPPTTPLVSRRYRILPLGLLALAILGLTAGGIAYSVRQQQENEVARLQAIAHLKTRQIADWMGERYGDARFVRTSRSWAELYHRWRDTGDELSRTRLLARLEDFRRHNSMQAILLLDEPTGTLWDSTGGHRQTNRELAAAARRPRPRGDGVLHYGPYRDAEGLLHLDFLAPLPEVDGRAGPVVVLHTDPAHHLFPILQTWPVPSVSGETLLFRQDGNQVLFLNELRHQAGTACRLRLPLETAGLLAGKILRDHTRLGLPLEGVDYRGVPALGVARAISGTDWFMVAKVDRQEIFSMARRDAVWIGLAGLLALFMAATGAMLLRQHQELGASLRVRELQAERLRALQLLDAIAEGSVDAIFAKDREGRYLLFNRAAERVVGRSAGEMLGRDDTEIFPPAQAALIMANDRQVMDEDRSVTFQEDLTTSQGEITFLATKGPLHDAESRVAGMFGIARDITERRRAEAALQDSLAEKVALLKEVHHRVKNNLQIVASLLSLQARRSATAEVVAVLQDTGNRVRAMALLHEVLYRSGNLARINFATYVGELCRQLLRSSGPADARVDVHCRVAPIDLALEQAVPCGLIISELVGNAFKHGFPLDRRGQVVVELQPDGEHRLILRVRDDGVGLPPGMDLADSMSLGLKLVANLAGQLGGRLETERPPEGGAAFRVVFPVPAGSAMEEPL